MDGVRVGLANSLNPKIDGKCGFLKITVTSLITEVENGYCRKFANENKFQKKTSLS